MKLTVLGSGSTGNAVLIVAGNTRVLVDAGLSAKEIVRRLALVGEDVQRLVKACPPQFANGAVKRGLRAGRGDDSNRQGHKHSFARGKKR